MIAEISVKVSFLKHTLIKSDAGIVEGDYNTTKLVFTFDEDVSGKRIVFKMSNPAGELIFLKDLEDNEVLLVGKDADGYTCSLFPVYGLYPFELVIYGEESKLTSAPGWLNVTKSQVALLDSVTTNYLPLFDKLLTELGETTLFLRFSEYPDGTDFTEDWEEGQGYVGIASGLEAPTDKSQYQWCSLSTVPNWPIAGGKGNSIVLNDIHNNNALSGHSTASGTQTVAGAFAFKITACNSVDRTYTLSSTPDAYKVGDEFSVRGYVPSLKNYAYYDRYGTITAINGNIVTVDNFVEFTIDASRTNIFHVPEKPEYGDTDIGTGAHSEGYHTWAVNIGAHSEGNGTKAYGRYSHTEGTGTKAHYAAHAEGGSTKAYGEYSHAEGYNTESNGNYSHTEGAYTTATNPCSHAEGLNTAAKGNNSHAEGKVDSKGLTKTINNTEYTIGALGNASHTEGVNTLAKGDGSHAEGNGTVAWAASSHAEGNGTTANGEHSHAEGIKTTANKIASHAEGNNTTADGSCSHAEGQNTRAKGTCSHAEGDTTKETKTVNDTKYTVGALGYGSHVEGRNCIADNNFSHAEGEECSALAARSHAGGFHTIAIGANQTVIGKYNSVDADKAVIVGGGSADSPSKRKNIFELDWDGNATFLGTLSSPTTSALDSRVNTLENRSSETTAWINDARTLINRLAGDKYHDGSEGIQYTYYGDYAAATSVDMDELYQNSDNTTFRIASKVGLNPVRQIGNGEDRLTNNYPTWIFFDDGGDTGGKLIIPNTVERIEAYALQDLNSIYLDPTTGTYADYLAGINEFYIPRSVQYIGQWALYNSSVHIHYEGSEDEWNSIEKAEDIGFHPNGGMPDGYHTISFNCTMP